MKKQLQVGLVVEGNSLHSAILRLPKLPQELGPIKSATLRVSRRLSNMLRAGYAVSDYEELQTARLILLRIPDCSIARIVGELSECDLVFKDLAFVLCESWAMNNVLDPLRARGAAVGTMVGVPSIQRNWFVVEGQTAAVRLLRRFLERNEAHGLEIRDGTKPLYFAAELLATALPVPLFLAAQQALRGSGLAGNPLTAIIDQMGQKMFQDLLKGARNAWGGPLTECSPEVAADYFDSLRRTYPQIARVVDEQMEWAYRTMPKHLDAGLSKRHSSHPTVAARR